jgi:hypothetical protein
MGVQGREQSPAVRTPEGQPEGCHPERYERPMNMM